MYAQLSSPSLANFANPPRSHSPRYRSSWPSSLYPLSSPYCPLPTAHCLLQADGAIRARFQGGFGVDSGAQRGRLSPHKKKHNPIKRHHLPKSPPQKTNFFAPCQKSPPFVIRISNLLRISGFGFRISPTAHCLLHQTGTRRGRLRDECHATSCYGKNTTPSNTTTCRIPPDR